MKCDCKKNESGKFKVGDCVQSGSYLWKTRAFSNCIIKEPWFFGIVVNVEKRGDSGDLITVCRYCLDGEKLHKIGIHEHLDEAHLEFCKLGL